MSIESNRFTFGTKDKSFKKWSSLLFGVSGGEGASVNVDDWLLPEVDPEDVLLVAVLLQDRVQHAVEPVDRGLAGSEDGESGHLEKRK